MGIRNLLAAAAATFASICVVPVRADESLPRVEVTSDADKARRDSPSMARVVGRAAFRLALSNILGKSVDQGSTYNADGFRATLFNSMTMYRTIRASLEMSL